MDDAFVNGSFEFDEATLSPTYRLRLGVPGNSKAAAIAARLGLKPLLVERARSLVDASAGELEAVIGGLEARIGELAEQKEHFESESKKLAELEKVLRARENELGFEREKIRRDYAQQIEAEFKSTEAQLKGMIADLQRQPQMARAQKAREELETIKKDLGWLKPARNLKGGGNLNSGNLNSGGQAAGPQPSDFLYSGNQVLVTAFNKVGLIQDVSKNAAGQITQVTVSMGSMKMKLTPAEVTSLSGKARKAKLHEEGKRGHRLALESGAGVSIKDERHVYVRSQANTIDLRGKRVEEALSMVEQFVDSCATNRVTPFMVIHGHGTGAVKSAIRDFLGGMRYKGEFRPGENYEGGDGVTVVDLTG